MSVLNYRYIIVGAGLTGVSAVEGLREIDPDGPVLLLGHEKYLPYDRPPLSKKLWFGQKTVEEIAIHPEEWYLEQGVEAIPHVEIVSLDPAAQRVTTAGGRAYTYDKLLLATGGKPRRLTIPGGDLEGLYYYRYLDDYLRLRAQIGEGSLVTVIGGGFIGSEMAAALSLAGAEVTLIYPGPHLVDRVFPAGLARSLEEIYRARGVRVLQGEIAVALERQGEKYITTTDTREHVVADAVVIGIGITPTTTLASAAGLAVDNGITVNEYAQTSHPDLYAAGDVAKFPYTALASTTRIEHWDHAINHGKYAGRNLAGAGQPYDYMPYFFSDLFEFGYEAVGAVDARLETFADWQEENVTGVIYYLSDGRVRGAMMCNVWDQVPAARELIQTGRRVTEADLHGAIGK
jgi:NADPH-dependent 2,4-dienoyl-CoA reductase/sulfur reductase-like enzyme